MSQTTLMLTAILAAICSCGAIVSEDRLWRAIFVLVAVGTTWYTWAIAFPS